MLAVAITTLLAMPQLRAEFPFDPQGPAIDLPAGHATGARTLFRWSTAGPAPAITDEVPFVTDRPDFTESSSTVGEGRVQIETGYTYVRDKETGITTETHSFPETLFRIGLFADWFELRIGPNYLIERMRDSGGRSKIDGTDDLYLGVKLWLTEQQGPLPEMTILPQMFVPSGDDDFSADEVRPGINWLYSWELNETFSVAGSTQINRVRDDTGHFYMETAQSATVGVGLTDQLGAYAEWFAFFPTSAVESDVGAEHFLNGGLTYLVHDNMQLDVRAGFGLNRRADDFFTGAGVTIRY